jgi:Rrf2 family protein
MMKISTKTEYGVRCLVRLARQPAGSTVSISEITASEHVPKHYAQQILMRLRRAGFVKSTRGTEGGFELARKPSEISVGEIVRVLEGIPFHNTCDQFNRRLDCGHLGGCGIRPMWDMISRRLWDTLDGIHLLQLMREEASVVSPTDLDI